MLKYVAVMMALIGLAIWATEFRATGGWSNPWLFGLSGWAAAAEALWKRAT